MGANRDIRCNITNRTRMTFTRHNSQLMDQTFGRSGEWMDGLDPFFSFNSIGPNETKSFGVRSKTLSVGTGASGWLTLVHQKSSVDGWDEYLYFEINNPYISDPSTRHFTGKVDVVDPSPESPHQASEFDSPGETVHIGIVPSGSSHIPSDAWEQLSDLPGLLAYTIALPVTGFFDFEIAGATAIDVDIIYLQEETDAPLEPVYVYSLSNFGGRSVGLKSGNFTLSDLRGKVSSLKVAAYYKVTFFDNSGRSVEFNNSGNPNTLQIDYVGDAWNDRIVGGTVQWVAPFGNEYAQINESGLPGAIIYEESNYSLGGHGSSPLLKSRHQELTVGTYNLPHKQDLGHAMHLAVRPDSISSVKVGAGYYIVLYDGFDQTGNQLTLTQNTPALSPEWNDRIKSVKIASGNPYLR